MISGSKRKHYLSAESREGIPINVPVAEVTGADSGPTLLVVAGVHGSEYVGIAATRRLFASTDEASLRGRLITVPCFGLPAFYGLAAHTCPIDGVDPGSAFPGDPKGSFTQRAAHLVWSKLAVTADAVIDVHGGDLEEHLVEYSQVTLSGDDSTDRAGEDLALALGLPLFVRAPQPAPSDGVSLFVAASRQGIPGILAEAGSHGELDLALVEEYYLALRGALVHLGMLDGELPGTREPLVLHRFEGVRAPVDGFWIPSVVKGETISKGQRIGEMQSIFGEHLEEVYCHEDGVVLGVISTPARLGGSMLIGLATLNP